MMNAQYQRLPPRLQSTQPQRLPQPQPQPQIENSEGGVLEGLGLGGLGSLTDEFSDLLPWLGLIAVGGLVWYMITNDEDDSPPPKRASTKRVGRIQVRSSEDREDIKAITKALRDIGVSTSKAKPLARKAYKESGKDYNGALDIALDEAAERDLY